MLVVISVNINNTAINESIFETLPLLHLEAHWNLCLWSNCIREETLIWVQNTQGELIGDSPGFLKVDTTFFLIEVHALKCTNLSMYLDEFWHVDVTILEENIKSQGIDSY